MSNELAVTESTVIPKESGNLSLTATLPGDMATCQQSLIDWCRRKIAELRSDAAELRAAVAHAKTHKWKTSTIANHCRKVERRIEFYGKMLAALKHGYVIVPNFPVTLFAIRTGKNSPLALVSTSAWDQHAQTAEVLPAGEGQYRNPLPAVYQHEVRNPDKPEQTITKYYADEWKELDFPTTMAKPQIMEATTNAMALQVFDQFGVLPSPYKKQDPLIVAQLIDKRGTYDKRLITFMVAWNLDTRTL